ncbi:MAG TPA: HipA N-terminal domain-containing protein, partial [bacterium]|nr:HipA N-terminal domain-containing protein [bacterium]
MVKTRKIRDLNVWMNGELVGRWSNFSKGIHEFRYYDSWLESVNARPLSLSLPLVSENILYKGAVVENYFDNLLP